jgi:hypothetical protein
MTDILAQKNAKKFHCENCNFICSKKSNYDKHLLTPKHQNTDKILTNTDAENAENANVTNIFVCECGNNYKHRQSLFNHKKKCHILNINNEELNTEDLNNEITPELIMCVLQQNKELQKMLIEQGKTIMELSKNSSNTNISNNNINSHNKTFNLQFFLNETCKDAMNIMDFVDSIKLQLCDLENVGKLGFVEGISKIIVSNLNSLDETKRPVHCTDSKREIMYVKDEDKWEKENETKQKMRKVIKHVTHKNSKLLKEFKTKYPGCEKSESRFSTAYDKLIIEAMGGKGDNDLEKEDKIIKNIAKNVIIDKHIGI